MNEFQFALGELVKCKLSGFTGIIEGRAQYLSDTNGYQVVSKELHEGKPVKIWVSEGNLEAN